MTGDPPLSVLVVEDQALVAMELQLLIGDAGHEVVGWATDLQEARAIVDETKIDLAFVDIHLSDGATGTRLAEDLASRDIPVVFMTANAKRVPDDFVGAIGVMAKPYTARSVTAALAYLRDGVRNPPPRVGVPSGLRLSPVFSGRWAPA